MNPGSESSLHGVASTTCKDRYVGRTSQKLQDRIKQHTSPNQSEMLPHALKYAANQNAIVNLQPSRCHQLNLYHAILPTDYIYYVNLSVHNIVMINNFLFSPKAALPFIYSS